MRWRLEEIDFSRIDVQKARADEDLLLLLCAASFVESGSDLYSRNLIEFFEGDEAFCAWLRDEWEAEELQHGRALKAYIAAVWPEFDWDAAFKSFFEEYAKTCSHEQFEKTPALELVARCVIETGTSTLYRTIGDCAEEPVLAEIARRIQADEVHHYKYFYRYFKQYNQGERQGRLAVLGALLRRMREVHSEDEDIAMRHVLSALYPELAGDAAFRARRTSGASARVVEHLPYDMSVKMLLKPLDLPVPVQTGVLFAATRIVKPLSRYLYAR